MVVHNIGMRGKSGPAFPSGAGVLGPEQRRELSVAVLAHSLPVTQLAGELGVSRQFCYQQAHKARQTLDAAFTPSGQDDEVLFTLPVTASWLRQFALAQALIGHTSERGVLELLDALFDYDGLSLGSVHNIIQEGIAQARPLNEAEDRRVLPAVRVGAHDEIFQGQRPVLVGIDPFSTYCYLLAEEQHRDQTTWGVHLLDLAEAGLKVDYTVADGAVGLRAGQAEAWPGVPCCGDVFHAERPFGQAVFFLRRRAEAVTTELRQLQEKRDRCFGQDEAWKLGRKLLAAKREEARAAPLAQDMALLEKWLREDVLAMAGEDLGVRRELLNFIIDELRQRERLCESRLKPLRRMLEHQGEQLLGFVAVLDQRLADIAQRGRLAREQVRAVVRLEAMDREGCVYWRRREVLQRELGGRFHAVEEAVREVLATTARASSMVENLNSRLRCYFFLRRQAGGDYLELLRFFLNHRRYVRSRRQERVGRSPAELLGVREHPHWLEMLGYQRFRQN